MVARSEVIAGPALLPADSVSPGSNGSVAESVQAVVLAGGHCWGENPLEQVVCRPLVPIAGRPLLVHMLEWLRQGGITQVSICVNQEARPIRHLLGDGSDWGVKLNYFQDVMPRGPAGCARDVAGHSDARRFLVVEGTILPRLDLRELLDAASQSVLTVVSTPARNGMGGKERFFGPAGIYIFSRSAFTHVPEAGYQDIKETLIPRLHVSGERVDTFVVDSRSVSSVNGLGSYLGVSHQVLEQLMQEPPQDGYLRVDDALIHRSSRIDPSVRLVGPVLVGPQVDLGSGSIVVGPATLGARTRIAAGAVLCRSVVWSDCVIEEGAVLDQCIVTSDSVVRAGRDVRHSVVVPSRRAVHKRQVQSTTTNGVRDTWKPEAVGEPVLSPTPVGAETAQRNGGMTLNLVGTDRVPSDANGSKVKA